jgi:hypothetical protein
MGAINGSKGKVMLGAVTIAELKEWSLSGFEMGTLETTAFGTTIKTFISDDTGDPGTISFSGNYDPEDTPGQKAIAELCKAGTTTTELNLYVTDKIYWQVASGGEIIVTKANTITLPRNGLGTISFEGKVSGAEMEQITVTA